MIETRQPHDHRRAASRADVGATFIELLVSIVLLGVAGVAVLVAAAAAATGARTGDEISKAQASLAEAADYLTDLEPENVPYVSCEPPNDPLASYQSDLDSQFGAGSIEVVRVLFWDQQDPSITTDGVFGATCRFNSDGDRLQQVRLRSLTSGSEREVDVIKRPVEIPTIDTVPAPPAPPYAGGSGQAVVSPTPGLP